MPEELIRNWLVDHQNYAYLALFIGTFLEGETILIIAAFMATPGQGLLHLHWAILSAFAGSFLGDETAFFLGKFKGQSFIARRPRLQAKAQKVYRMLERHHTWIILGFRFMYGLRNITPFALGMSQVSIKRFVLLNALGAALWALTYGAIGYIFGAAVEHLIKRYQLEVLATIVAVAVVVWLIRRFRQRRTEAAGPPPGAPPDPE